MQTGCMSTDPASELVTVLDELGRPTGVARRERIRAQNLLHAATAVLVRRPDGRIYVHRRTDTKDIYPGAHDCWAGGVLGAGEHPDDGARRELEEELGIRGADIEPLFVTRWSDGQVRAIYHAYAVVWDGEIVHQPTEVAWGAWWTPAELREHLADPDFPFVPDGRQLLQQAGVLAT
jgi:8-oxo-dGTP pyrophosphatase MutT (NUDIX family)